MITARHSLITDVPERRERQLALGRAARRVAAIPKQGGVVCERPPPKLRCAAYRWLQRASVKNMNCARRRGQIFWVTENARAARAIPEDIGCMISMWSRAMSNGAQTPPPCRRDGNHRRPERNSRAETRVSERGGPRIWETMRWISWASASDQEYAKQRMMRREKTRALISDRELRRMRDDHASAHGNPDHWQ